VRYEFIEAEKACFPVRLLCETLEVSRSGFYASRKRKPSQRAREDSRLLPRVRASYQRSSQTYGSPRIHQDLKEDGVRVSRKRVARLMREEGIAAHIPKRFRKTTDSKHDHPVASNILDRRFSALERPNQVWACDITYVWTWQGWVYLAVVMDLFSRRIVGWKAGDHMRTELVIEALNMALGQRCLDGGTLLHHSDRGSQYASRTYQELLEANGIECSMSRKGDCWDNAVVESFFGTLKCELILRRSWSTRRAVVEAIGEYIELFYNSHRRHSSLGFKSPNQFETAFERAGRMAA
jgi:putative transposase